MAFPYSNDTTYNLENVLRQNILKSEYYNRTCLGLTTWSDIVDVIYDNVEHVEPWMGGGARGPSTAFCLLHRLLTLQLTVRQVRELIDHKDSPYIRAVGFLFLRYVADPKSLWQWYSGYVKDREEFSPSEGGKKVTIGDFVRDLLLEQYYFETIFPRIPKPVLDSMIAELKAANLPTTGKGNGGAGGPDRRGVDDGNKRPASVKASLSVAMGQRAPNRAGAREDRQLLPDKDRRPPLPRSPGPDDGKAGSRSPLPPRSDRDRVRDRSRDSGLGDRDRERGHERDRRSRDEDRDGGRGTGAGRHDDRDRRYDDRRNGDRDRRYDDRRIDRDEGRDRRRRDDDRPERSRFHEEGRRAARREDSRDRQDKDHRRHSRSRSREVRGVRDREREVSRRGASRSRSRSRSRDRSGRDTRDVFREAPKAARQDVDAVRSKYL